MELVVLLLLFFEHGVVVGLKMLLFLYYLGAEFLSEYILKSLSARKQCLGHDRMMMHG